MVVSYGNAGAGKAKGGNASDAAWKSRGAMIMVVGWCIITTGQVEMVFDGG